MAKLTIKPVLKKVTEYIKITLKINGFKYESVFYPTATVVNGENVVRLQHSLYNISNYIFENYYRNNFTDDESNQLSNITDEILETILDIFRSHEVTGYTQILDTARKLNALEKKLIEFIKTLG